MNFAIIEVPGITVLTYLVGIAAKNFEYLDDKWIPVIVGVVGAILGIVAFVTGMPDFPANDIINAMAVGALSGLASTGANQIYKQFKARREL